MTASSKNNLPALILASASPRRKKLLGQLNYPFTIQPSTVDEHFNNSLAPADIARQLAQRKARDVAPGHSEAIILGADTIVAHNSAILEKPQSRDEAAKMLASLSESTHSVLTGVALVKTNRDGEITDELTFVESTVVTFGALTESEIRAYVATGSPMDKAGAYGIQDDRGTFFVKRIEGDYSNIVGLPLYRLYHHLKSFAPQLLQNDG